MNGRAPNRIDARFAQLRSLRRKALVPFLTAGDPSPEWTVALMHRLVEEGADVLELGVPFSDPTADGPVIQAASERAIGRGVGLGAVLDMVRSFRRQDQETPVILMGYLNPIERFGHQDFFDAARDAGVDGLLLVDCPPEEMGRIRPLMDRAGICPICLVAPTTTDARRRMIAEFAAGFIYYVSFKGITGANRLEAETLVAPLEKLRQDSPLPLVVGFGVKDAESAAAVATVADGVVIGSALVELLASAETEEAALDLASRFLAPVRRAMDNMSPREADQAIS
ncbi:MAG: tryptophan synthase subunit alpha [Xanthomonadales bacterium]|nr:tryptophan synthase subunit alpha [Xanthomonadales bacterium]